MTPTSTLVSDTDQTSPAPMRRSISLAASGALLAGAVTGSLGWRWSSTWEGHPARWVVLGVLLATAVLLLVLGLRRRRRRLRARWSRGLAGGAVVVGSTLIAAIVVLSSPYPATPAAVRATASSATVRVNDSWRALELAPRAQEPTRGLVFYPGVFVDPRAYARMLRPLAERGWTVVVVKAPLSVAPLAGRAARDARARYPRVRTWVVGGHSLGAYTAGTALAQDPGAYAGLLLWAGCAGGDLRTLTTPVLTIAGTRDAFVGPNRIRQCSDDLPPQAQLRQLVGVSHVQFGDYTGQPGDLTPRVEDQTAREAIVRATLTTLDRWTRR